MCCDSPAAVTTNTEEELNIPFETEVESEVKRFWRKMRFDVWTAQCEAPKKFELLHFSHWSSRQLVIKLLHEASSHCVVLIDGLKFIPQLELFYFSNSHSNGRNFTAATLPSL